ncbi:response regulator transcription factor [Edwardsiella tarda]|uniref:Helix-turn-helix transcriptional regulator n=1 Tax=Edwardsiella tarda ATCC 15947 = NBRC 105688 TaxID=667121 RepID=A0AC61TMV2_EDWTA|nr:helix-turn-helix transcriptional regulator [Edwardsiella tarda]UAL58104.1 helix-turn-helix transcriptional regulator [Edwardsiella tarda]UCQ02036.1 helix-turn-helix transcriptional regulator [Edwardsiella tarda ATCC 15947 = NBRC 105688]
MNYFCFLGECKYTKLAFNSLIHELPVRSCSIPINYYELLNKQLEIEDSVFIFILLPTNGITNFYDGAFHQLANILERHKTVIGGAVFFTSNEVERNIAILTCQITGLYVWVFDKKTQIKTAKDIIIDIANSKYCEKNLVTKEIITWRELEILEMILAGYSYNDIASFFSLSVKTIYSYVYAIQRKMLIKKIIHLFFLSELTQNFS